MVRCNDTNLDIQQAEVLQLLWVECMIFCFNHPWYFKHIVKYATIHMSAIKNEICWTSCTSQMVRTSRVLAIKLIWLIKKSLHNYLLCFLIFWNWVVLKLSCADYDANTYYWLQLKCMEQVFFSETFHDAWFWQMIFLLWHKMKSNKKKGIHSLLREML